MENKTGIRERVKIDLSKCQYSILKEVIKELKWEQDPSYDPDIIWQDSALTPGILSSLNPHQRINHFPGMYAISRKDYLAKNLKSMELINPNEFKFFPETWVMPQELQSLKNYMAVNSPVLIVKPPNLSQGKGIFLTRWISEILEKSVVQRYMENPYLIDGFKFDLRMYALITGFDPLRVYIHEDGLVRLATSPYNKPNDNNLFNVYMHLTNYAINKTSPNYISNKKVSDDFSGHKRSFKAFLQVLEEDGINTSKLLSRIDDIILKTLCTVQPFLSHIYRSCQPNDSYSAICFQVLGFDIFLDSRLHPHLLEVNHTPSFSTDSPLDYQIKKSVIKDCLNMIGVKAECSRIYEEERNNFFAEKLYKSFCRVKNLKSERKDRFLQEQLENETCYMGGYRRIFPCENDEKYLKYMNDAQAIFSNKKINKPRSESKPLPSMRKSTARRVFKANEVKFQRRKSCAPKVSLRPSIIHLSI